MHMPRLGKLALATALLWTNPAWAGPILGPDWIINEPDRMLVDFSHGPVDTTKADSIGRVFSPPIPDPTSGAFASFWRVTLSIGHTDNAPHNTWDDVVASGSVTHMKGPHGEAEGPIMSFYLNIIAVGPVGSVVQSAASYPAVPHESHTDQLIRAVLSGTVNPELNFAGLDVNIAAVHAIPPPSVPEPATLIQSSLGIVAFIVVLGLRRARGTRLGKANCRTQGQDQQQCDAY